MFEFSIPKSKQISRDSLLNLRTCVESSPKLWYTDINPSGISRDWAIRAMAGLTFYCSSVKGIRFASRKISPD